MFGKKKKSDVLDETLNVETSSDTKKETVEKSKKADKTDKTEKKPKKTKTVEKKGITKKEFIKRLKYGSLSIVLTCIVIAIIVAVNVVVGIIADKFPEVTIDTTNEHYFEISDVSKDYLATLEDYEIEIIFIGSKNELMADEYYNKIVTVAEKYEQLTPHLSVSCVDIDKTPGFETKYNNATFTVGDAVVSCGERFRHLNSGDFLISYDDESESADAYGESTQPKEYHLNAEHAITTAIMVVTASDNPVATVITGHGEKHLEKLENLLVSNGFTVNTQSIVKELDYESNLLIIAAPTKDYSEEDLKKLDDFLYNDGKYNKNVMYIADYTQPKLPNLEAFLYDWGIVIGEGVVYESDSDLAYANMPYLNILEYVDPDTTLDAAMTETTAYGVYGRPATIAKVLDANMVNAVMLQHSETSKIGTLIDGNFIKGEGEGLYVAMACTTLQKSDSELNPLESNLIFVNSTAFFEDLYFEKAYSANPDVTISTIDSALGRENKISVPTKSLTFAKLGVTEAQANVIGAIAAMGIPALLLIVCLVVCIRRRRL